MTTLRSIRSADNILFMGEMNTQKIFVGKPKRIYFEDLGIDGRTMLHEVLGRTNHVLPFDTIRTAYKTKSCVKGYIDTQQDDLINLLTKFRGGTHRQRARRSHEHPFIF
jgi:hypothetical protein